MPDGCIPGGGIPEGGIEEGGIPLGGSGIPLGGIPKRGKNGRLGGGIILGGPPTIGGRISPGCNEGGNEFENDSSIRVDCICWFLASSDFGEYSFKL